MNRFRSVEWFWVGSLVLITALLTTGCSLNLSIRSEPSTTPAVIPTPASISVSQGNNQTGISQSDLASTFTVVVKDSDGNANPSAQIDWTITTGGGSLSTSTSNTDSSGSASSTLTLGTDSGVNTVVATVHGTSLTTSFSATANHLFNGSLSAGFGTSGGWFEADYSGFNDHAVAAKLDSQGRILVLATGGVSATVNDVILYRLLTDGSLDSSFGVSGRRVIDSSSGANDVAADLAID